MVGKIESLFALATVVAATWPTSAQAEQLVPNLAGNYRCEAATSPCHASIFSIAQSGAKLDIKADNGQTGYGHLTSPITVSLGSPWNLLGVIREDGTIDWSTGTKWRKQ